MNPFDLQLFASLNVGARAAVCFTGRRSASTQERANRVRACMARGRQTHGKLAWLLAIVAIAMVSGPIARGQVADTTVDRDSVQIADPFQFTVSVTTATDGFVRFPEVADKLGPFQVLSHQNLFGIPIGSGRGWSRVYELESYESGTLQIPSLTLVVDGKTIATKPVSVNVQSVLEEQSDPLKFREVKDIVDIPIEEKSGAWIVWAAVAAVLLAATSIFLFARTKTSMSKPDVWAYGRLEELRQSSIFAAGDQTQILPPLVDILREYIDRRFEIAAPQQTTEEFLRQAQKDHRLALPQRDQLDSLLQHVDRIKFAHYIPASDGLHDAFQTAEAFIAETTRRHEAGAKERT